MQLLRFFAGIALASSATAQFIFPDASSNLRLNTAIQIQWNTAGLQAPLSINLVPAGTSIRQDIVLQQVAVNIGNIGILKWTAENTIAAFPQFAMVIVDARGRVIVSQPFAIQSLTRQPSLQIGGAKSGNDGKQNVNTKIGGKSDDTQDKNDNGSGKEGGKTTEGQGADKTGNKQSAPTGKEKDSGGSDKLIPLPGLPATDGAPVSLQPLPNAATTTTTTTTTTTESSASTSAAATEPEPVSTVIGVIKNTTQPPVKPTSSSTPTTVKQSSRTQPTPNGSSPVPPVTHSQAPSTTLPQQVKAAVGASETSSQLVNGVLVIPGGSFREQTSDPVPISLPSKNGQVTITTAITPRPADPATDISTELSSTDTPSAVGASRPTVLSGGSQMLSPSLVLCLACIAFGWVFT